MRFNCEICGKQFGDKPAAMSHHREKHEGRAHIIPGTGRSVLRRQINEAQAEIARLQAEVARLESVIVRFGDGLRDAGNRLDTAWNDALGEAAYSVAELAAHDAEESDWKDGARQARNIAAAIRALKRPT